MNEKEAWKIVAKVAKPYNNIFLNSEEEQAVKILNSFFNELSLEYLDEIKKELAHKRKAKEYQNKQSIMKAWGVKNA